MANTPTHSSRSKPPAPGERREVVFDPHVFGETGLRHSGGYVNEEFLPELKGLKGVKAYREMGDNDPIVGAILFAVKQLIRNADWHVEASGDAPEEAEIRDFFESLMDDMTMSWPDFIEEVCSMFDYGFACMEILYKLRRGPGLDPVTNSRHNDGRVGIRGLSLRAQETVIRWDIAPDDGTILGFWQQPITGQQVYIPMEKVLHFRTSTVKNNPEGRSLLRTGYRSWHYKKRIENIEAIGIERDLAGYPVAKIPGRFMDVSADAKDKATYQNWSALVTAIKRDTREGIVIPSDRDKNGNPLFELALLTGGGSRSIDTTKIVDRWQRGIATAVLADFIFLGQQAVGSFALSSDKTALFAAAIGGFMKSIAGVLNRQLVPRLMELNGWDLTLSPSFVPADIETPNLQEVADYISKLAAAGATFFPDPELENRLRGFAGLPDVPEEGLDMNEHVGTVATDGADARDGDGGDVAAEE